MIQTISYKLNNLKKIKKVIKENLRIQRKLIVLLKGNLGSGKTTLTRNLLNEMFHIKDATSPTFNLVNSYTTIFEKKTLHVLHCDFYRVTSQLPDDLWSLNEEFLIIIEWPEKVEINWQKFANDFDAQLLSFNFHEYDPISPLRTISIDDYNEK